MKCNAFFINTVLLLIFIAGGFSCKTGNTTLENVVYYYPDRNVYYDSMDAKYYYSLNGGRSWDSMDCNQPGFNLIDSNRIAIEKTTEAIWTGNETHRKDYNGTLLNIVNDKTIQLARDDSINKSRPVVIAKQQQVTTITKEEPPKKGLKKFFNKIFGKKKKPDDEKKQ